MEKFKEKDIEILTEAVFHCVLGRESDNDNGEDNWIKVGMKQEVVKLLEKFK